MRAGLIRSGAETLDELTGKLSARACAELLQSWMVWARDDQIPPQTNWSTWLLLGGRGAGKTRAGAEWVRGVALGHDGFGPLSSNWKLHNGVETFPISVATTQAAAISYWVESSSVIWITGVMRRTP